MNTEEHKRQFRNICVEYLPHFRTLELPTIQTDSVNEAVFIDFRELQHIELLVRNAILKIGGEWSYTIVCGNTNYDFCRLIAQTISENIKVIRLDYDAIDINGYNNLLLTVDFWNLFTGKKILLYQEDSFIFKGNIGDFMRFDYIGAPWNHLKGYTVVGNGGFSLRNRLLMIELLNRIPVGSVQLHPFIAMEMRKRKMTQLPEDVYFSRAILMGRVGRLADIKSACMFSIENLYYADPLGGHQFWVAMRDWKNFLRKNLFLTVKKGTRKERTENTV